MTIAWLVLGTIQTASAAEATNAGAEVSATARVGTSHCWTQPTACQWMDFRDTAVFSPWVQARPTNTVSARAAIDVRAHGPGNGHGLESEPEPLQWSLRVQDIWVATRSPSTEFKLGVYRTAWGVANGISIVDTMNPLDLEDPTRFDRRLSVPTATLTVHSETLSLSGIIVPFFVPARLPATSTPLNHSANEILDIEFTGGRGTDIGNLESRPAIPGNGLDETTTGIQCRWTPSIGDFSMSWHHGRDSLPQIDGDLLLVGYQTNTNKVDVGLPLAYPRLDIIGFSSRTPLFADVTGWVEIARILPERTSTAPSRSQLDGLVKLGTMEALPDPIPTSVTQDGEPITKWVVGADRSFGAVRLTAQWLRGFFTERRQSDLQDYGLLGLQWSVSDTVRIDSRASANIDGYLVATSLEYLHDDTVEFAVGVHHIDGQKGSTFSDLRNASNLYSRVSMRF